MRNRSICVGVMFALAAACALPPPKEAAKSGTAPALPPIERQAMHFDTPAWHAIDELASEQKLEAARAKLAELRTAAEAAGNTSDWTRALIRDVQLQAALGGIETAVRSLRQARWPEDGFSQLVLEMYYAETLINYLTGYAYEIAKRERVESKGALDLKLWTREQILAEALTALQHVWAGREALRGPADIFGPYVTVNNYPAGIRDTLRDVVSYHLVELLANTQNWRPVEQNELFRLDHAALSSGPQLAGGVADGTAHPLLRASYVLHDLSNWHAEQKRPEAALEAQLELLRLLHANFSGKAEQKAQITQLTQLLEKNRSLPWWSMGQLLLAQWSQQAGSLPQARIEAQSCVKAYPDSLGAKACQRLISEIEAPSFSLSGMLVDGPQRRSLEVQHRNLKQLFFRAYPSDLPKRISGSRDYNLLPNGQELQALLKVAPAAAWQVSLPDLGDYQDHRTFVTPPLTKLGYYVVFASPQADFSDQTRVDAAQMFVSGLVVRHRRDKSGALDVQVFEGDSGKPAKDVELTLYQLDWRSGHQRVGSYPIDAAGRARVKPGQSDRGGYVLLAKRGDDISPAFQNIWFGGEGNPSETNSAFIFTDRSIYRPQQKVEWKILAFHGRDATWQNLTGKSVNVTLHDANGEEVQKVSVKTNDFGTASGSFIIPAGRLLGNWSIQHSLGSATGIQVEEYKRPTFEVKLKPADKARLNQPVHVRGEASYYFGLPVQNAPLRWRVERQERYPWWWGFWRPPLRAAQVVAAGDTKLDAQGQFTFTFTPAADPQAQKGLQYTYHVVADLTDEGGETRSATRDFALGQVSIDAHLSLDGGFVAAGGGGQLLLRRENLDGDPRPGVGRYRIVQLAQPKVAEVPAQLPRRERLDGERKPSGPRTAGDALRSRQAPDYSFEQELQHWADGASVHEAEVKTDEAGKASIALPKLAAGAYRVYYDTVDEFSEKLTVKTELVVADTHTPLAVPAVLKLEKASVQSGEVARVLATTGLGDQPLWLEVYRDATLLERRELAPGAPALQEIKIGPAERGGISIALVGLRDYQPLEQRANLFVPWDDRELSLEFSSFRDLVRPGQKETFKVTVRGKRDHALVGAAELLAYMYDRSLDAFTPHQPPVPLQLYPVRTYDQQPATWSVSESSIHSVFNNRWNVLPEGIELHGDVLEFPNPYAFGGPGMRGGYGYGGGGMVRRERMAAMADGALGSSGAPMPAPAMARAPAVAQVALEMDESSAAKLQSKAANAAQPTAAPAGQVRSNFAETAFFIPRLLTAADGSASIEFSVPDSVTSWNVWVHAITRDFRSGSVNKETRSVKDLLVRPYLPRFMRESDQVSLKVVVQNAGKEALSGALSFELFDPHTDQPLNAEFGVKQGSLPFQVAASGSTNLTIPVTAPRRVGDVAVRVSGKAGTLSDGELRPLPLLPSRLHLVQSKFATLRGDGSQRSLQLQDLADTSDQTRSNEQLVVNVDAQLFMTVLKALPFLVDYPYECTEQTLNRFLSAGIVASVFEKYPAVKQLASDLVKRRDTLLDKFADNDPNRKIQLEESPWLVEAQGGPKLDDRLIKVLDPQVAAQERDRALARLTEMQTASGGFPWFPGGPPSPYMTLYLMIGMARATEFDMQVPKPVIARAWQYLAHHYRDEIAAHMRSGDAPVELITLLHYGTAAYADPSFVAGAFTPAELQEMLDYAFARWTKLPPLLKCVLATSLIRAKKKNEAKLVFSSVMDSAKTTEDEGTFWKPEDRAWLWYNDHIETHAFALRTLLELDDKDPKLEGLVVWLLLNKKLNQWKSTRATAEVIYSLTKYLDRKGQIAVPETITLEIGEREPAALSFVPTRYQGKAQVVVPGADVKAKDAHITAAKSGKGVAFVSATWHYATDKLPSEGRGDLFHVERSYFKRDAIGEETKLTPLAEDATLEPGDEVEVQLEIEARAQAEYVHLRDPRPAGLEPALSVSKYHYDLGIVYYEEIRDSAENFFIEWLPAGKYTLKYRLRANLAGQFRVGPATLQSMYAPEFAAFSAGHTLRVQ
ncbi:MAG TPA: MG2 domain-containing protein [Polyangiales bacterium]|nr:MG2 domain-containing protein [Polyangiales bacterium]